MLLLVAADRPRFWYANRTRRAEREWMDFVPASELIARAWLDVAHPKGPAVVRQAAEKARPHDALVADLRNAVADELADLMDRCRAEAGTRVAAEPRPAQAPRGFGPSPARWRVRPRVGDPWPGGGAEAAGRPADPGSAERDDCGSICRPAARGAPGRAAPQGPRSPPRKAIAQGRPGGLLPEEYSQQQMAALLRSDEPEPDG